MCAILTVNLYILELSQNLATHFYSKRSGFMAVLLKQWLWYDRQSPKVCELQIAEEFRAHRVFSFLSNSGGLSKILVDHGTHPQCVEMGKTARGLVCKRLLLLLRNGNDTVKKADDRSAASTFTLINS